MNERHGHDEVRNLVGRSVNASKADRGRTEVTVPAKRPRRGSAGVTFNSLPSVTVPAAASRFARRVTMTLQSRQAVELRSVTRRYCAGEQAVTALDHLSV